MWLLTIIVFSHSCMQQSADLIFGVRLTYSALAFCEKQASAQ